MAEMLKVHGYLYSTRPVAATMHLHTAAIFLGTKTRLIRFFQFEFSHKLYIVCQTLTFFIRTKFCRCVLRKKSNGNIIFMYTLFIFVLKFPASKWPIEHQKPLVFGNVNVKTLGKYHKPKGAVYARIRKKIGSEERVYHVVGLHFFVSMRLYTKSHLI